MPAIPAPQMTTSAVGALMRGDMVARPARLSTLLDRLDRQLAGRAQSDRVDAVLPHARRHRLAVQRADAAALGLLGVVGQLPESRPELALEGRRRALGGVALRDLPLLVEHLALRRPFAVGEDPSEEQERLALERVARDHEVVVELDHERVDVDLVTVEHELARLADRIALRIELGETDPRPLLAFGARGLIQHHEPGASLGVAEEPDGRFEGLIALRERADLRVALLELALQRAARRQDHAVSQVHAASRRGDEDQRPEDSHGRSLDGTRARGYRHDVFSTNLWKRSYPMFGASRAESARCSRPECSR